MANSKKESGGKPTLPQGMRDFGPDVVRKRNFILSTIRSVFELYGFQPLETPAMENLETLMGKYGEEGDKLIFKILNNGLNHPGKEVQARNEFEKVLEGKFSAGITERALKYDLTIPFARYVAMNHGQLTFPFKRYQIQPVWRADRPQKGRYREFYQCDADIVGSDSLLNEVEFVQLYQDVFSKLGLSSFELRINSRKILAALSELCGGPEKMTDLTIAIDKLDKIGWEGVKKELEKRDLQPDEIGVIEAYLQIEGTNENKLEQLQQLFKNSETGTKGIAEIQQVLSSFTQHPPLVDLTLARGLNYYTGIIFEAKAPPSVTMGSIGGGGRYDDLTGLFGVSGIPGVGISFGVDRIYDVLEELKLFPTALETGTRVLFFHLGNDESKCAFSLLQQVRKKNVPSEIFHEEAKFDKQFKYAEKKRIPFVVIIGSKEMEAGTAIIKDLRTGEQKTVNLERVSEFLFI